MVLMIPRRAQGVSGEDLGLFGHFIEGLFQVVEFFLIVPFPPALVIPLISLDGFQSRDEQGIHTARDVFRRHSITPPLGSVEVGSAVALNDPHLYYAPGRAPLPPRNCLARDD
jgi:hypothetical protein